MAPRENGRGGIRVTYDQEGDTLTIRLARPIGQSGAEKVATDHYLEIDERGRLTRIRVLKASQHYSRSTLASLPSPVRWLTLNEAGFASGLSPETLRKQANLGRLPAEKRGRDWIVAEHELLNYLENRDRRGRRAEGERMGMAASRSAGDREPRRIRKRREP